MGSSRIALALAVLTVALLAQVRLHAAFGAAPDFALAALLSTAAFMSIGELLISIAAAVLVLNWQPAASVEMLLLVVLPLMLALAARLVSLQSWAMNVLVVAVGLLLFPLIAAPGLLRAAPGKYAELWALGVVFGAFAFRVFAGVFGKIRDSRHTDA